MAVVIAETKAQARDAAELVSVTYEELKGAPTLEAALKPGAPAVHDDVPGNVLQVSPRCSGLMRTVEKRGVVLTAADRGVLTCGDVVGPAAATDDRLGTHG